MSTFISLTAIIIRQIAVSYNQTKADKQCEKHFRRMLSVTIRNATEHPSFTIEASKAARLKATELGIPLEKMTWANQPRWDKGRKIFAYEHMVPVNVMMRAVMANPEQAEAVLRGARVAWILRTEDQKLNDAGFKSDRDDPVKAYESVGIEV